MITTDDKKDTKILTRDMGIWHFLANSMSAVWLSVCVKDIVIQFVLWPLTPKIDRATWPFLKIDMRHIEPSDMKIKIRDTTWAIP